ncbi:hypothetical protein QUF64_15070 [Anaerolineales bacterium HSG6]|nr:hypothetical protein [Anaerolineales bacterium HSG6]
MNCWAGFVGVGFNSVGLDVIVDVIVAKLNLSVSWLGFTVGLDVIVTVYVCINACGDGVVVIIEIVFGGIDVAVGVSVGILVGDEVFVG